MAANKENGQFPWWLTKEAWLMCTVCTGWTRHRIWKMTHEDPCLESRDTVSRAHYKCDDCHNVRHWGTYVLDKWLAELVTP